ncbi:MAG: class F sortase [Acidimicrobiales bacterium]
MTSWLRGRAVVVAAAVIIAGGGSAIGVAVTSQYHAPRPGPGAYGSTRDAHAARSRHRQPSTAPTTSPAQPATTGPLLDRSLPVSIAIPAIQVQSALQYLGLNPDGTIAVPQPGPDYNEAAWYEYGPTPGQLGPSVIEGHIDSAVEGPSVFFDLGALVPGDQIDVSRADGIMAVFTVTGVRQYPKVAFPTATVYGNTNFAALRLITCGGSFDHATGHYLNNTVVFASLTSSYPVTSSQPAS